MEYPSRLLQRRVASVVSNGIWDSLIWSSVLLRLCSEIFRALPCLPRTCQVDTVLRFATSPHTNTLLHTSDDTANIGEHSATADESPQAASPRESRCRRRRASAMTPPKRRRIARGRRVPQFITHPVVKMASNWQRGLPQIKAMHLPRKTFLSILRVDVSQLWMQALENNLSSSHTSSSV